MSSTDPQGSCEQVCDAEAFGLTAREHEMVAEERVWLSDAMRAVGSELSKQRHFTLAVAPLRVVCTIPPKPRLFLKF